MKSPTTIRLPFKMIPKEGIGAGDLVKKLTKAVGLEHCPDPCEKRRKWMNDQLVIRRK